MGHFEPKSCKKLTINHCFLAGISISKLNDVFSKYITIFLAKRFFLFWTAHRKFPSQKIYSNHYYLAWKMRSTQKVIALAIISMAFRILCTHCIQSLHFTQDCIVLVSIYWHGMFLRAEGAPSLLDSQSKSPLFPIPFVWFYEDITITWNSECNNKETSTFPHHWLPKI